MKLAIIGGGPIGTAALAHALEHNLEATLFEASHEIGHAVRQWGHVKMFSPAAWNIDRSCALLLRQSGWSPTNLPVYLTGGLLVSDYLEPLAQLPAMADHIRFGHHVHRVERRADSSFLLHFSDEESETSFECNYVIDASGTWFNPRQLRLFDDNVNPLLHYHIPDKAEARNYCDKTIAVVGMGDSACNSIFELTALGCVNVIWLQSGASVDEILDRKKDTVGVLKEHADKLSRLIQEGSLDIINEFNVESVCCRSHDGARIIVRSEAGNEVVVDEIVANIGFQPDLDLYNSLELEIDPRLRCPVGVGKRLADSGGRSALTIDGAKLAAYAMDYDAAELRIDPGGRLFVVGMKSYGTHPGFLLKNGYQQVEAVIGALARQREGA
ncbi:MAG: NAD(P)-binding domain-containing protein [Mycobacterium sp.]